MKKLVTALAILFAGYLLYGASTYSQVVNSAKAQEIVKTPAEKLWWPVSANVTVTSRRVTAAVYNGYGRPIFCSGRAMGYTYWGQTLWSTMNVAIPPGRTAYVYVYSNDPRNPFVGGDGQIQCRWY